MTRMQRIVLAFLVAIPGCFPIDLDTNNKGDLLIPREEGFFLYDWRLGKTTRLPWHGNGLPVYARLAPNATDVVLASSIQKGLAKEFRLEVMPIQGGEPRLLYKTDKKNGHSAVLSPDGKKLAVVQFDSVLQNYMPEIHIVELANTKSSLLADKAGPFVHWLPDSKRLLTIKIDEEVDGTHEHLGRIGLIDASDGSFSPLAILFGDRADFFASSPDLKRVLFSAYSAGKDGLKLDPKDAKNRALFELDLDTKAVRKLPGLDREIEFARYAPDGKRVLLVATRQSRFLLERCDLIVTDADLQNPTVVARNANLRHIGSTRSMPGWLDDKAIYYFAKVNVYGTAGHAIHLRIVNADGSNNRDVQPDIDLAVEAHAR